MRKWVFIFIILSILTTPVFAQKKEKLMVYTSMKETLIGDLKKGFEKKYPNVSLDYYSAGAGKIMAKIAAERQSGKLAVDVIWTSEVPDFYSMKKEGILQRYESPEAKNVVSPLFDPDYEFTPARLGTLGITYNTNKIKTPPKEWTDLLTPEYKNGFGIANPALSGTAMVSVAMLVDTFGWDFIQKLRANGAKMGEGSGQVVDDTAAGDLLACIGVDYITIDKIKLGAPLGFAYPRQMLVIPSPVAIFKGTRNLSAAQNFVDFLLSKDGQTIIANNYTLPIRRDVSIAEGVGLVSPDEAVKRSIKIDYLKLMNEKQATIDKFISIMQSK
ncbi:MAG TPA: ABC transporter substrate-binding protein [Rectinema sp.]|jgi:iron(III) transport system substrate-binding protein|nr:ABC transporter substrate-binding protein [Rectinema sp.]